MPDYYLAIRAGHYRTVRTIEATRWEDAITNSMKDFGQNATVHYRVYRRDGRHLELHYDRSIDAFLESHRHKLIHDGVWRVRPGAKRVELFKDIEQSEFPVP